MPQDEHPPLGRSFLLGFSADDQDYPILAVSKDPRVPVNRVGPDVGSTSGLSTEHIAQYPACLFTHVQSPTQADTRTLWIYEVMPGPWIPSELIDPLRGPVQRRRRTVLNTGQVSSQTLISQTTYEGRDGSSIVSWEIVETYTDGTGAPGAATNPAFPVVEGPMDDDLQRGPVHSHSQLVNIVWKATAAAVVSGGTGGTPGAVTLTGTTGTGTTFQATGTINGSGILTGALVVSVGGNYTVRPTVITAEPVTGGGLTGATVNVTMDAVQAGSTTISGGIYTEIRYEPFDEFHLKKVTTYWAVPGPTLRNDVREDKELGVINGTRRLVANTNQAPVNSSTGRTRYEGSGINDELLWEIVETWVVGNFPIQKDNFHEDARGAVYRTKQLTNDITTAGTLAVSGGTATDTSYEAFDKYLRRIVIETWSVPETARTYTLVGRRGFLGTMVEKKIAPTTSPAAQTELIDVETRVESKVQVREQVTTYAAGGSPLIRKDFNRFGGLNTIEDKFVAPSTVPLNVTNSVQELIQETEKRARLIETIIATGVVITTIDQDDPHIPGSRATVAWSLILASAIHPADTDTETYERLEFPDNPLMRIQKKTTYTIPDSFTEYRDLSYAFPTLFTSYVDDIPGVTRVSRSGFSNVVPHLVTHSFSTTGPTAVTPYKIIENDFLVFSIAVRGLTDSGLTAYRTVDGVTYTTDTLPTSTPSKTTYEGLVAALTPITVGGGSEIYRAKIFHTETITLIPQ